MQVPYFVRVAVEADIVPMQKFGKVEFARTYSYLSDEGMKASLNVYQSIENYTKWVTDPIFQVYVAFDDETNKIVGYIVGSTKCSLPLDVCGLTKQYASTCGEIKSLYTDPCTFGSGLGCELLTKMLDWLQNQNLSDHIYLDVYSGNARAIKFYQRLGFEKVGEYEAASGDAVDLEYICHWKGFPNKDNTWNSKNSTSNGNSSNRNSNVSSEVFSTSEKKERSMSLSC